VGGLATIATTVFGGMFLFHAQHEAAASAIVLTVQHRIFGATLAVAALAKAAAELGGEKARAFRVAWLLPLLVFGLEMLLYTEGGAGMAGHGTAHGGH